MLLLGLRYTEKVLLYVFCCWCRAGVELHRCVVKAPPWAIPESLTVTWVIRIIYSDLSWESKHPPCGKCFHSLATIFSPSKEHFAYLNPEDVRDKQIMSLLEPVNTSVMSVCHIEAPGREQSSRGLVTPGSALRGLKWSWYQSQPARQCVECLVREFQL